MPDSALGLRPVVRKVSTGSLHKDLASRFEASSSSSSSLSSPTKSPSLSRNRPGSVKASKSSAKSQVSFRPFYFVLYVAHKKNIKGRFWFGFALGHRDELLTHKLMI